MAARDHFGIKPLYYYADRCTAALRLRDQGPAPAPAVRAEVDHDALRDYLTFQFVLGDATLFQGMRKLLPGTTRSRLASGDSQDRQFWEPAFRRRSASHRGVLRRRSYAGCWRTRYGCRCAATCRSGRYLSGGLDSSIVTLLAAAHVERRGCRPLPGRSRKGRSSTRLAYAREVAGTLRRRSRTRCFHRRTDFVELLPKLVYHMDEPAAGPGLLPQYIVSRMAAEAGQGVPGRPGRRRDLRRIRALSRGVPRAGAEGRDLRDQRGGEHIVSLRSIVPHLPSLHQYVPMLQQFWSDELSSRWTGDTSA